MTKKYLECSTEHITEADDAMLRWDHANGNSPLTIARYEFGLIVFLPFSELIDVEIEGVKKHGYSEDMVNLVRYAASEEASLLVLDRDGPIIDGLHINDW